MKNVGIQLAQHTLDRPNTFRNCQRILTSDTQYYVIPTVRDDPFNQFPASTNNRALVSTFDQLSADFDRPTFDSPFIQFG